MSETTTLTVRIDPALKERLKAYATEKEESLSQVVAVILDNALTAGKTTSLNASDVDNQSPEGVKEETALTSKEIKALRKLLRKK